MVKNILLTFAIMGGLAMTSAAASPGNGKYGIPVRQTAIHRVDAMPDMPSSYRMIDWKTKARSFDAYVFNWHNDGKLGPFPSGSMTIAAISTRPHSAFIPRWQTCARDRTTTMVSSMRH